MFTNISWTDYIVVVTILLAIYYLFVGLRFYFHELKNIVSNGKFQFGGVSNKVPSKIKNHGELIPEPIEPSQDSLVEDNNETFQEVENLIHRLKEAIEEGVIKQLAKQDFSKNLRSILKEYPSLKNSTFRAAIIELIVSESEKYGSTTLNGNEVEVLWDSD